MKSALIRSDAAPSLAIATPSFETETVTDFLRDGYWLEAADVDGDGNLDLIGYGLSVGEIYWY